MQAVKASIALTITKRHESLQICDRHFGMSADERHRRHSSAKAGSLSRSVALRIWREKRKTKKWKKVAKKLSDKKTKSDND